MYKIFYFLIASIFAIGCIVKNKTNSINITENTKKWVYIGLKYDPKSDTLTSYYYGQVENYLFDEVLENTKSSKMFELSNIRYYNLKDSLIKYEDTLDTGTSYFYIKDIIRIDRLKKDPLDKIKVHIKVD